MHATIVVLSALVAVAAGQYWHGYMPLNHALGVPLDTPEVYHAKVAHAYAHAAATARSVMPVLYRKRREAPAAEASAEEVSAANAQPAKRQLFSWGYGSSWAYPTAYSSYYNYPLIYKKKRDTAAVSSEEQSDAPTGAAETPRAKKQIGYLSYWGGWGPTAYAATWPTYPHYLYRKRRDVSDESSHKDEATHEAAAAAPSNTTPKDKRQIILESAWGYPAYTTYFRSGLYNPWGLGGYLYRKRRDVSPNQPEQTEQHQDVEESEKPARGKRQYLVGAWGYPYYRTGYYPYVPQYLYRKRRDTNSQAAPEENTSTDSKQKRQLLLGLGYPYAPYVMPYYGARLGHWW